MRPKGRLRITDPEKMPVITTGIHMSAKDKPPSKEELTGGNQPADETSVAELVCKFIEQSK